MCEALGLYQVLISILIHEAHSIYNINNLFFLLLKIDFFIQYIVITVFLPLAPPSPSQIPYSPKSTPSLTLIRIKASI